jgi:hypothetical protein
MNKLKQPALFWTALALVLFSSLVASNGLSQSAKDQMPKGHWTLGTHAYMGPDQDSLPVFVYSVTSQLDGATITEVGFENRSSKVVAAVKLGWYLTTELDRDTILQQGQTPLLGFRGGFAADTKRALRFPVVSFAKVYKPLLRGGVLKGNYRIEVVADEVRYDDGSSWTRTEKRQTSLATLKFVKTANRYAHAPAQAGCAKQQCQNMGGYYRCTGSPAAEYCTNKNTSCTNTICPAGGGGGEDPGPEEPILYG